MRRGARRETPFIAYTRFAMVTIREATPADEDALRQLEDASPQGHDARITTERTTFF